MTGITQGSIISGMRSCKYPDIETFGIIISARCDLAQGKISKIFYLTAIPLQKWLLSSSGFHTVITGPINSLSGDINKSLEKYGLRWEIMKDYSSDEFRAVVQDQILKSQEATAAIVNVNEYLSQALANI